MELGEVDHQAGHQCLTGTFGCGVQSGRADGMEMDASCSRTFTDAARPSTSLTVASTRRMALVMAAQTMSAPASA